MLLLDTHVLLWLVTGSSRLGAVTTAAIKSAPRAYFSAVSITEIRLKEMLGRLDAPAGLVRLLKSQGLEALPLAPGHADRIVDFPDLVRHDPFDRLLLAQAATEQMSLLTVDRRLLGLELPFVVDASA